MTTKEFWEIYANDDASAIFDAACILFSKPLPEEFVEDGEVNQLILEIIAHQENTRNFDKVIMFTALLQKHQPEIYQGMFEYLDDFLIDYYSFTQDDENLHKAFASFLENPEQDFERYMVAFKKILFYQKNDLVKKAISARLSIKRRSDNSAGGPVYDLKKYACYLLLHEMYEKGAFDKAAFVSKTAAYGFEFKGFSLDAIEKGMFEPMLDVESLKFLSFIDKMSAFLVIKSYFFREMHNKGFTLYLSEWIWHHLMIYWQAHNASKGAFETFFNLQDESFSGYLGVILSEGYIDGITNMVAALWSSVYVFDFLYKYELISEKTFLNCLEVIKKVKGKVICGYISDLWNCNFIHSWEKPDSISETEFLEENKIFKKSIYFKSIKFSEIKNELSEELSRIGELSSYILEGEKDNSMVRDPNFLDKMLQSALPQLT